MLLFYLLCKLHTGEPTTRNHLTENIVTKIINIKYTETKHTDRIENLLLLDKSVKKQSDNLSYYKISM